MVWATLISLENAGHHAVNDKHDEQADGVRDRGQQHAEEPAKEEAEYHEEEVPLEARMHRELRVPSVIRSVMPMLGVAALELKVGSARVRALVDASLRHLELVAPLACEVVVRDVRAPVCGIALSEVI